MMKDRRLTSRGWRILWSVVFGLNLIFPLFLGWNLCGPSGRVGLGLAIAAYWGLGLRACAGRALWGRALIYGGTLVAFSQFYPTAQYFAGLAGLSAWSFISGSDLPHPLSGLGGFFVTGVTGGLLQLVALIPGWIIVAIFHRPSPSKPRYRPDDEF